MIALFVFWASVVTILFVYLAYPLLIWLVAEISPKETRKATVTPSVSILIAAYDEEASIAKTLDNKLALDYPKELLEIIVVSDASSDGTDRIVHSYQERGVKLLVQQERRGKTAALNRAASIARGEILVFADANSIYRHDSLKKLVQNFADETVGYVTGKMMYVDEKGSVIGKGCTLYMRYENCLRALETRCGSIVGVDGGIDAVRKALFEPMREELLPDLVLPLSVVRKGRRVVYEEEAILNEETLSDRANELGMRTRVILRSLHAMWFMKGLFNPGSAGGFALQLLVHKLLRYFVGVFQIGALVSNLILVDRSPLYLAFLAIQMAFYAAALVGLALDARGKNAQVLGHVYYFCLLNWAALVALSKFLRGQKQIIWAPRHG